MSVTLTGVNYQQSPYRLAVQPDYQGSPYSLSRYNLIIREVPTDCRGTTWLSGTSLQTVAVQPDYQGSPYRLSRYNLLQGTHTQNGHMPCRAARLNLLSDFNFKGFKVVRKFTSCFCTKGCCKVTFYVPWGLRKRTPLLYENDKLRAAVTSFIWINFCFYLIIFRFVRYFWKAVLEYTL